MKFANFNLLMIPSHVAPILHYILTYSIEEGEERVVSIALILVLSLAQLHCILIRMILTQHE